MELIIKDQDLRDKIYTIRGMQVMLDSDLAELYGVKVKVLNQVVKRNMLRFPKSFCFQLVKEEYDSLRSQIVTLDMGRGEHKKYLPYVFTEQGVSMLAGVLKSDRAIKISIRIIELFVSMRRFIQKNANIFLRLDNVERKQLEFQMKTDKNFEKIFSAIEDKTFKKKQGIFYDGQIFDAYIFVSDLIRTAKSSIILVDNYVDDSVLTLFSKCEKKVKVEIYTANINKQFALDLLKFNSQYSPIKVIEFKQSHDRFLIIDEKDVYHFGASLKDLGKKWFAFTKFEKDAAEMISRLK